MDANISSFAGNIKPENEKLVRLALQARLNGDNEFFEGIQNTALREALLSFLNMVESFSIKYGGLFEQIVAEILDNKYSPTLEAIVRIDYKEVPVTPYVFFTDKRYAGRYGEALYPANLRDICWILDPANEIIEAILTGSIRWGKTTVAVNMLLYKLYLLSLLRNPQKYFGLMEGSAIRYGIFNLFKYKTRDMYERVRQAVDTIPYFVEKFPRLKSNISEQLRFNNQIEIITGSTELHALGETLIGAILDEMNFMKGVDRRTKALAMEELGQAQKLYTAIRERARLQFLRSPGGVAPWLLMLLSQRRAQTDFLEKHIEKHGLDKGTCVISRAIWEVQPPHLYSGKKFLVVIGDQRGSSRILAEGEVPPHDANVIEVPEEHRAEFEANLDEAIRNVAGRATIAASALFNRPEVIIAAKKRGEKYGLNHPFKVQSIVLSESSPLTIQEVVNEEVMFTISEGLYKPRVNPTAPRVMHIDLASTQCSAGLACVHMCPAEQRDIIVVDFVFQINPPPPPSEIDYEKIVDFILWLRERGFLFKHVSFDQYQSRHSQVALRKRGIDAKYLSVDLTDEPYIHLKGVFASGLIAIYEYPVLERELVCLEHDISVRKVLKPENGSKDIADALCGAVFGLMPSKPNFNAATTIKLQESGPADILPMSL